MCLNKWVWLSVSKTIHVEIQQERILKYICQDHHPLLSFFYMTCSRSDVVSTKTVFRESSLLTPKGGLVLKVIMVTDVLLLDCLRLFSSSLQVMLSKRARRNLKSWKMLNQDWWLYNTSPTFATYMMMLLDELMPSRKWFSRERISAQGGQWRTSLEHLDKNGKLGL